jgi:hypothetical protein
MNLTDEEIELARRRLKERAPDLPDAIDLLCDAAKEMKRLKAGRKYPHPVEANGPANIVTLIDAWRIKGPHEIGDPEIDVLRRLAMRTVEYMRQLEGSSPVGWGEFTRETPLQKEG